MLADAITPEEKSCVSKKKRRGSEYKLFYRKISDEKETGIS